MFKYTSDDGNFDTSAVVRMLQGILYNEPEALAWANDYNGKFYSDQNAGNLPHFMWQSNPNPIVDELTGHVTYGDYERLTGTNNPALQKVNQLLNPGGPITLPDY